MKNVWVAFVACLLAMAQVTCVVTAAAQPERPNLEEKRFIGTVVAADDRTKTLVVRTWLKEVIFDVATTHFAEDDSLHNLKPGDRVLIRYIEDNGRKIVGSIIKADRKHMFTEKAQSGTHMATPAHDSGN